MKIEEGGGLEKRSVTYLVALTAPYAFLPKDKPG